MTLPVFELGAAMWVKKIPPENTTRNFHLDSFCFLYKKQKRAENQYIFSSFHLSSCYSAERVGLLCVPTLTFIFCGESGIRTHDTLLEYTHFPGVLLRPLGHLSFIIFLPKNFFKVPLQRDLGG